MKVEKLVNFLNEFLHKAEKETTASGRQAFFYTAFGAVQFALDHDMPSEVRCAIATAWEEDYRPKFEELIWG